MIKKEKILKTIIIIGTVLAALKMLFIDYSMDEEYQVVLSYRMISGDMLFREMWEPHQTSAFICTLLMRIFLFVTGSFTGVIIWLRFFGLLFQAGISYWIYKILIRFYDNKEATLVSLLFFNIVPKLIQLPEFGNQQVWLGTILALCFIEYETNPRSKGKIFWIILSGIALSLEILSYPSMIVIAPIAVIYLALREKKNGVSFIKAPLALCLTCLACAGVWFAVILSGVPYSEFIRNVHYIVSFDLTHDLNVAAEGKLVRLLKGFGEELVIFICAALITCALCLAAAYLAGKKTDISPLKKLSRAQLITLFVTILLISALLIQLFYWAVLRRGFEEPHLYLLILLFVPFALYRYAGNEKKYYLFALITGIPTFLAVLYMSDLAFCYALPHALCGCIFAVVLTVSALKKQFGKQGKIFVRFFLIIFVLICTFGKGFTLRSGRYGDITHVAGIMKEGPAKGILADYMCAYIYNSNYEDFNDNIEPGSNVLIVTNMVFSPGTTPYMFDNSKVCHFSIVDPTSYDERLLTYWQLYPGKKPDIIVVDCWYGELKEDPDNWIMNYIENGFGYTEAIDGKYVRFYKVQ